MALIRHSITGAVVEYPDEALPHLRRSGWETVQEWNDREAARVQREADEAAEARKAAKADAAKSSTKE